MAEPVGGFVELRGLERFVYDAAEAELQCTRCERCVAVYDDEGYGVGLRFLVVAATDHLGQCVGEAS